MLNHAGIKRNCNAIELLQCEARTTQYSYRRKDCYLIKKRAREQYQKCICYV